jgi:hypothetical protein
MQCARGTGRSSDAHYIPQGAAMMSWHSAVRREIRAILREAPMKRWMVMSLLAIALVLTSSRASFAEEPASATPTADEFMAAAFPGWKRGTPPAELKEPPTQIVEIHLPDNPDSSPWLPTPGQEPAPQAEPSTVVVTPIDVIRLDETYAALLTQSTLVEDGKMVCGPSCSRYTFVGVYFFKHGDPGWKLSKRVDAAAFTMYGPKEPKFHKWPGHGFVFSFLDGDYHQGASSDRLVLIGLQPDHVLPLLHTSIAGDNRGFSLSRSLEEDADIECGAVLDPAYSVPKNVQLTQIDCQEAEGTWRLDGDLVHFEFRGSKRKDNGHGGLQPLERWQSTATLELRGDTFKLIKGSLPQFGF